MKFVLMSVYKVKLFLFFSITFKFVPHPFAHVYWNFNNEIKISQTFKNREMERVILTKMLLTNINIKSVTFKA